MAGGKFQRRGGITRRATATRAVSPDVAIVLDTACWAKTLIMAAANHRQIGNGPMLVLSDKSLIAAKTYRPDRNRGGRNWRTVAVRYVQQRRNGRRGGAFNRHWRTHSGDGACNPPRTLRRIDCRLP
ncbi:hypothetical protein DMI70_15935 [Escherichia coli]|nr:hypothetical protein [Escherichia coli]